MKTKMKDLFKMMLTFFSAMMIVPISNAQDAELNTKNYTTTELKQVWNKNSKGKGWNKLMKEMEIKGLKRIEESSWGFGGILMDPTTGKSVDVEYCVFDFYSPSAKNEKSFQTGSMIWRKIGDDTYKAYIVFPKGESDVNRNFEGAQEYYTDENDNIKKAHSFGTRFNDCIKGGKHSVFINTIFGTMKITADCKTSCLSGVLVCGGVTAILSLASGGLGAPLLLATFGICAGVTCASCFTYCALSSL
jgi:hypothetical protein